MSDAWADAVEAAGAIPPYEPADPPDAMIECAYCDYPDSRHRADMTAALRDGPACDGCWTRMIREGTIADEIPEGA